MKHNAVNLITFARGENQAHSLEYMTEATFNQIDTFKNNGFRSTVLLMYDALIEPAFHGRIKNEVDANWVEAGVWFEIPKQLVEAVGLKWRGREGHTWDWFNEVGFLIGYTIEERKLLIDEVMDRFLRIFGFYPTVVGSWHIDAFSLNYLSEKYNVKGSCMCRDQWGTDGYTIWGGYEPAYYPSKYNMLCPANSAQNQINMPVFRMLGADPLYQFDIPFMRDKWDVDYEIIGQITLEPTILADGVKRPYSGPDRNWTNWYLDVLENEFTAPFSYAQTGQENGFGWFRIGDGIKMHCELLSERVSNGTIIVETLGETSDWFRKNYCLTPCVTVHADKDWMKQGRKSIWYFSRFYRLGLLFENDKIHIRELRVFREEYPESYLLKPCRSHNMQYDNLPVVDGTLWSVNGKEHVLDDEYLEQKGIKIAEKTSRAGLYFVSKNDDGKIIHPKTNDYKISRENDTLTLEWNLEGFGQVKMICEEETVCFIIPDDVNMRLIHNATEDIRKIENNCISYCHNVFDYSISLISGSIEVEDKDTAMILPQNEKIIIKLKK